MAGFPTFNADGTISFPGDVTDLTAVYPDVQPHYNNNNPDTKVIVWPDIINNNTQSYLHDCALQFNEIQDWVSTYNLPYKILLKGSTGKVDYSESYYIPPDAPANQNGRLAWHPEYYHYTHETIKRIAEGDSWLPSNFPNKQVATYGKTTVYYLTQNGVNENNGIHDYTQTLQMSINLGKWSD
jgi:hypothetical protein